MMEIRFRPALALLGALALTGLSFCALAEEPATEPHESASEESAEAPRNYLRWATASEINNFGYDVYRSDSEDGPFERVTSEPLLGAGTTDELSNYEFVDQAIEPDTTYWYYIESISKNGDRERFTPVFKKQPRRARDPAEGADEEEGDPAP